MTFGTSKDNPFRLSERLGLFIVVEATILSLIAVSSILCLALYRWLRCTVLTWGSPRRARSRPDAIDSSLFLNLMFADMVQATANMPMLRWMIDAHITEATLCTAQGVLKQIGIVGVSLTSLAIAVQTFAILVLRWRPPRRSSLYIIASIWTFDGLLIGIANALHPKGTLYGNTDYWCWVRKEFPVTQILTEYLYMWGAGVVMFILYTIMFLVIRGWLVIDNGIHWQRNYNSNRPEDRESQTEEDAQTKAIANLMLFYPAVYIFSVLPNSISRWMFFSGHTPPYQFTFFAATLFALSGASNTLLFMITRPRLVAQADINAGGDERDPESDHPNQFGRLPEINYANKSLSDKFSRNEYLPKLNSRHSVTTKERLSLMEDDDYGRLPG